MKALITGASGGIGREIAYILADMGYELVLVARSADKLEKIKSEIGEKCEIYISDLSVRENCFALYEKYPGSEIDLLVNNAGYGVYGEFIKSDLDRELNMIDLNIVALHILTKLYLKDFVKRDSGRILEVGSIAGFFAGGYFSSYYASKNYVVRMTEALAEELRRRKSKVTVSALCPGPVDTGFNDRAGVIFPIGGRDAKKVAQYAVKKTMKGKTLILPYIETKAGVFIQRLLPRKLLARFFASAQKKKGN